MSKLKTSILKLRLNKGNSLKNKKGAELVENMLMMGVAIALIVVIFYPQIMQLMDTSFDGLEVWFSNAISRIGQPVI